MGDIFIYPTDTAYALGCAYDDKKSISRILKIKKRQDKKFTIIASSLAQAKKFFKLNSYQIKLARKYWPGPLSIVVSNKYAIRVPASLVARDLARRIGKPIIATSANISGQGEKYSCPKLSGVNFFINAGKLKKNKPSTIIDCRDGEIKIMIIRQGAIKIKKT